MEEFSEEIDINDLDSIDDFIKELEAREKDLDISSETVIEIEESEFDDSDAAEMPAREEPAADKISAIEPVKPFTPFVPDEPTGMAQLSKFENEIDSLRKKIAKMEAERTELFELSRRRQTDFDNYKKRTERDKNDTFHTHLSNLAIQILPVFDNLNRAMDSASDLPGGKSTEFQQFFDGIVLVNKQLSEVLLEMGVKAIKSVGEAFDPHFHEAVATEETDKFPSNTVTAELLRGYMLGEKVIRPAMVKVSTSMTVSTTGHPPSEFSESE